MSGDKKGLYCCAQCAKDVQKPKWNDIVSLFNSYNYELISTEYINAKSGLEYVCNKHKDKGIQKVRYGNLKNGFGCKYCGREKQMEKRRSSFDEVKELFAKHDMILLDQEYINSQTPLMYICTHHKEKGIQWMTASNAHVQHCPYCNISKGENEVIRILEKYHIKYSREIKFDGLGELRGRLSYDFYLPDYNLLIEYQGRQHEMPVSIFGGVEMFIKQQDRDKCKRKFAKDNNIELLEIWHYDFKNIESILIDKLKIQQIA